VRNKNKINQCPGKNKPPREKTKKPPREKTNHCSRVPTCLRVVKKKRKTKATINQAKKTTPGENNKNNYAPEEKKNKNSNLPVCRPLSRCNPQNLAQKTKVNKTIKQFSLDGTDHQTKKLFKITKLSGVCCVPCHALQQQKQKEQSASEKNKRKNQLIGLADKQKKQKQQ